MMRFVFPVFLITSLQIGEIMFSEFLAPSKGIAQHIIARYISSGKNHIKYFYENRALKNVVKFVGETNPVEKTYNFYFSPDDSVYTITYCIDSLKVVLDDSLSDLYREDTMIIPESSDCLMFLVAKLSNKMSGWRLDRKIDFTLAFVQQIKHVDDIKIYKEEKILSPESLLAKQAGDCDDKTILFAFLVKKILNLDCVWLEYPNESHANCAVKILPKLGQESFRINEEYYVIAEPSGLFYDFGTSFIDLPSSTFIIKPIVVK